MRKPLILVVSLLLAGALTVPALAGAKTKKAKAAKAAATKTAPAKPDAKTAPANADAKPAETKPAEAKPAEGKPGNDGGKAVFTTNTCNKCHRVTSAGIQPIKEKADIVDLSGVGAEHDVAWFKQWLKKEIDKDSKLKPGEKVKHKGSWKGTDAELDVITAWLKTLTKK